jgi:hypothetical protein
MSGRVKMKRQYKNCNVGDRFGKLTIQKTYRKYFENYNGRYADCLCDCGNISTVFVGSLTKGDSRSCGCNIKETKPNLTHGMRNTRLYSVWCKMKGRCYNENDPSYKDYGGRGIYVCDEWKDDFVSFYLWSQENGYADKLEIDRINNNGGYSPDNCRWTTKKVNCRNRRSCHNVTINGETKTVVEWAEVSGVSRKTVFTRIYRGWDYFDAIFSPVKETSNV